MLERVAQTARHMPALVIVLTALLLILLSTSSSFRVAVTELPLAWRANFDQALIAAAAGLAFGVSAARVDFLGSLPNHLTAYQAITFGAAGFLLVQILGGKLLLAMLLGVASAVVAPLILRLSLSEFRYANIMLLLALAVTFAVSVLNYLAASVLAGGAGEFVLWLMGEITLHGFSNVEIIVPLIGLLIIAVLLIQDDLSAVILFGLAIGIAGPLVFLGWMAPSLLSWLTGLKSGKIFILLSGLLGATLAIVLNTVPSLLLGGYAPSMGLVIVFAAMPFILYCNRISLLQNSNGNNPVLKLLDKGAFAAVILLILILVYHLAAYAHSAS
jgi:ABC-type Fe3+-siderophore transport system permease subunit